MIVEMDLALFYGCLEGFGLVLWSCSLVLFFEILVERVLCFDTACQGVFCDGLPSVVLCCLLLAALKTWYLFTEHLAHGNCLEQLELAIFPKDVLAKTKKAKM